MLAESQHIMGGIWFFSSVLFYDNLFCVLEMWEGKDVSGITEQEKTVRLTMFLNVSAEQASLQQWPPMLPSVFWSLV